MEKVIKKALSVFLAIVFLYNTADLSLRVFAAEHQSSLIGLDYSGNEVTGSGELNVADISDNYSEFVPYIVGEDTSLRQENIKHFRQSDGSYIESIYQEPVHYRDADGKWQNIDNTLILGERGFSNKSNDFEVVFNSNTDHNNLFTVNEDGNSLSLAVLEEDVTNEKTTISDENEESLGNNTLEFTAGTEASADTSEEEFYATGLGEQPETEDFSGTSEMATEPPEAETSTETTSDEDTFSDSGVVEDSTTSFNTDVNTESEPNVDETTTPVIDEESIEPQIDTTVPEEELVETETNVDSDPSDTVSDTIEQEIERPREISVILSAEKSHVNSSDLKTASEVERELKLQNPGCTEEEIKEAIDNQSRINEDQRKEIMTPESLTSAIEYKGFLPEADLRYDLESKKIKESIIIDDTHDEYCYTFSVDTDLHAEVTDDGNVVFYDASDEAAFVMPAPLMVDAKGMKSDEVEYILEVSDTGYILSVLASDEWINDETRQFPVIIDPTVVSAKTDGSDWNIIAQYITSADLNTLHSGDYYWKTGAEATISNQLVKYYSFMKIQYLPAIPFNCKFSGAILYMPHLNYENDGLASYNLIVKEALSDWRSQWTSGATNNNPIIDYLTLSSADSGSWVSMNVTNAVRNWYDGYTNNGLVFTAEKINGNAMTLSQNAHSDFCGYYNTGTGDYSTPFLAVEYRNVVGIEDYHSYETLSVDGAGTAYINDYTGYVTLVKDDVVGNGYTLSHVYNSSYCDKYFNQGNIYNTVDYSNMKIGLGWKLNAQQSVVSKTITGVDGNGHETNTEYLIYSDGDGTEHYFHKDGSNSNLFKDEDGLGLTLTRSGNTITMADDKNNQKIFEYGYLSQMIDRNGNKTVFLYDTTSYSSGGTAWKPKSSTSGGKNQLRKIIYIPDGAAEVITCATLQYNSSNQLTSVLDRNGGIASFFSIGSTGLINTITQIGSRISNYLYGGGNSRMSVAYDAETNFGMEFKYRDSDGAIERYKDFTAPAGYNGTRTYYHLMYMNVLGDTTRVRDCGYDMTLNSEDDILTTYVTDNVGRTVTSYTTDAGRDLVSVAGGVYTTNEGTNKTNNRLTKAVYSGTTGHNLLWNSGFEEGSANYWNTSVTNTTSYSATVVSTDKHTGNYSLKLYNGTFNGFSMASQSVTIPKTGSYTVSANVKINDINIYPPAENTSGFRLTVQRNNATVAYSDYIKEEAGSTLDGWIRTYCTFDGTQGETVYPCLVFTSAKGTVYVDDVQIEFHKAASPYNLLSETYLRSGTNHSWLSSLNASFVNTTKYNGSNGYVLKVTGAPSKQSYIAQDVNVNLPGTETYMLSGWAKAASVAPKSTSTFQITATVHYTDGTYEYFQAPFSTDVVNEWQYVAKPVIPNRNKVVSTITVTCSYKGNANIAYFDEVALFRESAQAYTYNSDGKVVAVNQTNTDELTNVYSGGDLISESGGANGQFDYTYDSHHNVTQASNGNLNMNLTYDSAGNVTSSRLQGTGNAFMQTSSTYSDNKTKVASTTDNLGNTTTFAYNNYTNLLTSTTAPVSDSESSNGSTSTVKNTYYSSRRPKTTYIDGEVSLLTNYTDGKVSSIVRGGYYNGSTVKENQTYTFEYNDYGQITSTSVGNVTLSTNTYDNRARLIGTTYGNGDRLGYSYDNLDRIESVAYYDTLDETDYIYDNNSNLSRVVEINNGNEQRTYFYEYDSLGRMIRQRETNQGDMVQQIEYAYDTKNRVTDFEYFNGTAGVPMNYTYRDSDGALTDYRINGNRETHINYDSLNRVSGRNLYFGDSTIDLQISNSYKPGAATNQTTGLVSSQYYNFVLSGSDFELNYDYDNLGNIIEITDENNDTVGRYMYDRLNQLVYEEVCDAGAVVETRWYKYDTYGNIREVQHYAYSGFNSLSELSQYGTLLSTELYGYPSTDSSFRDQLTSYNGVTITYDGVGNPLTYNNGTSYTMSWVEGRQLASVTTGGVQYNYNYNGDGIRTSKVIGSKVITYRLAGDKIVEMTQVEGNTPYSYTFLYDENGNPYSVTKTDTVHGWGSTYYYVLDLQGDVIKILDTNNNAVVNYTYDAWGKIVSIRDQNGNLITNQYNIGRTNPFRYRGYVYDEETGFYYCQSRYYDPSVRRWINLDGFVSTGTGFIGYNMYAYCNNNPVGYYDPTGKVITEWDKVHLSESELKTLAFLTRIWKYFRSEREWAHSEAVKIREKYLSGDEYVLDDGNIASPEHTFEYSKSIFTGTSYLDIQLSFSIQFNCIHLDMRTTEMYYIVQNGLVGQLASTLLLEYESVFGEEFYGRTVQGISYEIYEHYYAYRLYFLHGNIDYKSRAAICDMENIYYNGPQNWSKYEH